MARFRDRPEDFVVEEELLYPPSGVGAYTLFQVEKTCHTTTEVAGLLARHFGRRAREVGFAGRKDRFALTRQWFSLAQVDPGQGLDLQVDGVRVLAAVRHGDRLRLGELLENRFRLTVRELGPADLEGLDGRLRQIERHGFANRFGDQRFGKDGDNASRGAEILCGKSRLKDRRQARFLVSALQSAVFDQMIVDRARLFQPEQLRDARPIDLVQRGDVAIVHRTGRLFPIEDPEPWGQRVRDGEISATGWLFGSRAQRAAGEVGALEQSALEQWQIPQASDWRLPFTLSGARRPLRVIPSGVRCQSEDDNVVLELALPPGSYATVALAELFPGIVEGGAGPGA